MGATVKDLETSKFIRAELLRRGMTRHDLARLTGYTAGTVSVVISGNGRSPVARRNIERALGTPIWSTAEEFASRQADLASSQSTKSALP